MENLRIEKGDVIAPLDVINNRLLVGSGIPREILEEFSLSDCIMVPGFYVGEFKFGQIPESAQARIGINLSLLATLLRIAEVIEIEILSNADLRSENIPNILEVDEHGQGIAGFSMGRKTRSRDEQSGFLDDVELSICRRFSLLIELDGDEIGADVASSEKGIRSAGQWAKELDLEIKKRMRSHVRKRLSKPLEGDAVSEALIASLFSIIQFIVFGSVNLMILPSTLMLFAIINLIIIRKRSLPDDLISIINLGGIEIDKIAVSLGILQFRRLIFELTEEESAALHKEYEDSEES